MILFLTGDSPDLAPDLLFNGFVELFGQDSIIDFPYAEYRHKNVSDKLQVQGRDFFCLTIDRYVEDRNKYNFNEIKQLINNDVFDLCVIANRALNTFTKLMENTTKFPNIIMINGEDDSDNSLVQATTLLSVTKYWERVDLILQRDYKYTKQQNAEQQNAVNKRHSDKIVPYNFPCPVDILPVFDFKKDKEIDVFAQFPGTHQFRSKVIERLKKIKGINTNIKQQNAIGYGGLGLSNYFRSINNSKISISITGAGWDTPHYLEIPFMKSMLLAQHPMNAMNSTMKETPVIYLNNFVHGHSAQFYETDLDNLELLIRYYLDNDKERKQITKRGYEHLMKNLTTKKTAEYVLKCLNDNNYWKSLT